MDSKLPSLKIGAIIQVNMSPNDGNIAFTSINDLGTKGELNLYVLKEYGYYEEDLPKKKDLINGFALLQKDGLKPIIFIVTVNEQDTSSNLRQNFSKAITKYQDRLIGKRIWIPLMGTGAGNLTIEESYRITINVINNFSVNLSLNTTLLLSIPNTKEGNSFHINTTKDRLSQDIQKSQIENFIQNFQSDFYLINNDDEKNKKEIESSYNNNTTFIRLKNNSNENIIFRKKDILIIRSTYVDPNRFVYFNINALGIITEIDAETIKVVWPIKNISVSLKDLDFIPNNIQNINKDKALKIFNRIIDDRNWNSFLLTLKKFRY